MSPPEPRPTDQPLLAAEAVADAYGHWSAMPRQRLSFLGKWRNPIGLIGAGIVGFNLFIALFGKYIWTLDPDAQDSERLLAPTLGAIRWAPTSSGATSWRGSSTARRCRSRSGSPRSGSLSWPGRCSASSRATTRAGWTAS